LGESLSLISGTWFSVAFHMFVVIETTDHERRRRMTFEQVGIPARKVLLNAMAARGQNGAHEFEWGGDRTEAGEDSTAALSPIARLEAPRELNKKHGVTVPAVVEGHFKPSPAQGRPVLAVIQGNSDMRRVPRRPTGLPSPALRRPILLVVGGRDHARSRSG
jgi:hypothetical protein